MFQSLLGSLLNHLYPCANENVLDIKSIEFAENAEYTKIYSARVCLVSTFNTDVLSLSKYIST